MCTLDGVERVLDIVTPRNMPLSAYYKRSYAFHTVKTRLPVILTRLIDALSRDRQEIGTQYGAVALQDLKAVIGELSKLKYEIQTDKTLTHLNGKESDVNLYNNHLDCLEREHGTKPTFFSAIWLTSECYMYRRIYETFTNTKKLASYDPFLKQKQQTFYTSIELMVKLGGTILGMVNVSAKAVQQEFISLLKATLWGNKCDLSLSGGAININNDSKFDITILDEFILSDPDDLESIWDAVRDKRTSRIVDIVLDNCGYELFADLCLCDYMIARGLCDRIRFHVKSIPWFVSDVMLNDFTWTIETLQRLENMQSIGDDGVPKTGSEVKGPINLECLRVLGERWHKYLKSEVFQILCNEYWTLPVDYSNMRNDNLNLYRQLAEAKLILFKGDLNYRKLFGERNWCPNTPISEAIQQFGPTKLCAVRTIKSDIICDVRMETFERLEALQPDWKGTGEYGVIQFSDKIVK